MSLQQRLRICRKSAGYTQHELAKKSGLSRSTIAAIEIGLKDNPSCATVIRLARAIGVDLSELLGKTGKKNPHKK
jgi:transcriptional regulator with XRE-family HTH domain